MFLTGGGSHIDMFDPKPESPEIKGEFGPIATTIPGVNFSDKMPGMAARAGKLAIVRSMAHGDNRHLSGTHNMLTGAVQPFNGNSNQDKSLKRSDWPSIGSIGFLSASAGGQVAQSGDVAQSADRGGLGLAGATCGISGPQIRSVCAQGRPQQREL